MFDWVLGHLVAWHYQIRARNIFPPHKVVGFLSSARAAVFVPNCWLPFCFRPPRPVADYCYYSAPPNNDNDNENRQRHKNNMGNHTTKRTQTQRRKTIGKTQTKNEPGRNGTLTHWETTKTITPDATTQHHSGKYRARMQNHRTNRGNHYKSMNSDAKAQTTTTTRKHTNKTHSDAKKYLAAGENLIFQLCVGDSLTMLSWCFSDALVMF